MTGLPPDPLEHRSLADLARDIRSGAVSAQSLVETYLQRIRLLNPKLDAVSELDSDRALMAAKGIDLLLAAGQDPGPLAGLPVLVKDLYHVNGLSITAGSRMDLHGLRRKKRGP